VASISTSMLKVSGWTETPSAARGVSVGRVKS